jgi:hypothetical protein
MDRIQTELCLSSIVGIFRRPFYSCCISRLKTFLYEYCFLTNPINICYLIFCLSEKGY